VSAGAGAGAGAGVSAGTACGKVILLGEHAVVYGTPAIAAGIERGARALARRAAGASSTLTLTGRSHGAGAAGQDKLDQAFAALLAELVPAVAVEVEAESDLPAGGGLGSSAALGVAIARAVLSLCGAEGAPERVLAAAGAWERVFHGNPSGIDAAAAERGGCFLYTRAHGAAPLAPHGDIRLCVGWSGTSSSTGEMVAGVARLFERRPDTKERVLPAVASLVENARLAIESGDLVALGRLMDLNQMLLAGLFLSTEAIERMCALAREAGALGAKLTGGGGGGCVIAVAPGGEDAVREAWSRAGHESFFVRVGGPAASQQPAFDGANTKKEAAR
jgi:mevalonate kinase